MFIKIIHQKTRKSFIISSKTVRRRVVLWLFERHCYKVVQREPETPTYIFRERARDDFRSPKTGSHRMHAEIQNESLALGLAYPSEL